MIDKQAHLTEQDQTYLAHIAQALQAENGETFNLDQLSLAWLTTDQLRSSAVYWGRYSRTRPLGRLVGGFVSIIGIWVLYALTHLTFYGMSHSYRGFTLEVMTELLTTYAIVIPICTGVVLAVTLGIGHGLAVLLFALKKNKRFSPIKMKREDHLAVKWTLQRHKLLPRNSRKWLKKMENLGIIKRAESGFFILNSRND